MSNLKTAEAGGKLESFLGAKSLKEKGYAIIDKIIDGNGNLVTSEWIKLVNSSPIGDQTKNLLTGAANLNLFAITAYLSAQATSKESNVIDSLHSKL